MVKKVLLASALILVGTSLAVSTTEARGPYGVSRSGGFRTVGPVYRTARPVVVAPAPVFRTARPVVVAPAPVYRSPRVYTAYPPYNYRLSAGVPVYPSYRPSIGTGVGVGVGVRSYGFPAYGPTFGPPSGFPFYFGR